MIIKTRQPKISKHHFHSQQTNNGAKGAIVSLLWMEVVFWNLGLSCLYNHINGLGRIRTSYFADWHRTRCCKYTEVLLRMGTSVPEACRGT